METALTGLVGLFYAVSIYLMLSKHIIRVLLGIAIFGNAVNMTIFTAGRVLREVPPIIAEGKTVLDGVTANPLPQALILTAIVISFSFFAFLLVLAYRAYQDLGTDDTDEMRIAEPRGEGLPPLGY
ncbi:Na+/H+ antiporter subunit C [Aquibium microcysteis]|uniref:Na+/H+ antiporter subunit C n=1 Tax=Aquibium microcysteis TaxID=675281 RepID=UPI00165D027E|nr:Na+/H+ antiporter subunit C [Aquibium microcysteis]